MENGLSKCFFNPPNQLLGCSGLIAKKMNRSYVLSTEGEHTGGFSKWPDAHPGEMLRKIVFLPYVIV